jgi:hypothetical protein
MERYKRQFFLESLSKKQVEELIREIKEIEVTFAEGKIEYSNKVKGKKFRSLNDAQKFFNSVSLPDMGYYKHDIIITFKDGSKLEHFQYDHGPRDLKFTDQLKWYLENEVSILDVDDKFTDKIKALTQSNNHIEARLEIAKNFKLAKYEKIFSNIENIMKIEKQLPQGLNIYMDNLTKEMFTVLKFKDKEYADKLWEVL